MLVAVLAVTALAGAPVALWRVQGVVLADVDWAEAVADGNVVLLVAAVLGGLWITWLWLVAAVVHDVLAAVRRAAVVPKLPAPLAGLVSSIAGAVALLVQPAAAGAAAPAVPAAAAVAVDLPSGQVSQVTRVVLPAVDMAQTDRTYTVRRGDTLSRIAGEQLGDRDAWPAIFEINKGRHFPGVGGTLTNPNRIFPGWQLHLPPPSAQAQPPAAGPAQEDDSVADDPAPPAPSPTMQAPSVAPPSAGPSATAAAETPAPTSSTHAPASESPLWAEAALGAGLLALGVLAYRLRARRAARPRPPRGEAADAALAGEETTDPGCGALLRHPLLYPAVVAGEPGRRAVAAFVADAIAGHAAGEPATAQLIVPAPVWQRVRPSNGHSQPIPGITVTADLAAALRLLEELLLHRARLVEQYDTDHCCGAHHPDPDTDEQLRPIVLIAELAPDLDTTVTASLDLAGHLDLHGILLEPARRTRPSGDDEAPDPEPVADTQTTPAVPVRITVLGRVTVHDQTGHPVGGLRQHARELLAYLVAHRGGADLPDILEALWPDASYARAQQRLQTDVSNLRRGIRTAAGDSHIQPVLNPGGRYRLDPDVVDVDAWNLADAITANTVQRHGADDPARLVRLRAAVAVPAGRFAADFTSDWIEPSREALRRQAIRARTLLAVHPDTDPRTSADLLDQAADLDPASDELAREAIKALTAVGDDPRVQARWQVLSATLAEIDEEPEPETLALIGTVAAVPGEGT
ncbi:LysM peptidoglycan-binding domain-containing protein [Dactylosporangium sp. NPDC051541]|uniref:LysM peptidoglycan-binding domain-containing protein n=1 Tax=Dactylosporangium sp. NPDC051541 TaxID=3363977 RepID=UPI00379ED665